MHLQTLIATVLRVQANSALAIRAMLWPKTQLLAFLISDACVFRSVLPNDAKVDLHLQSEVLASNSVVPIRTAPINIHAAHSVTQ